MIEVCHPPGEAPLAGPFGRDSLLSELAQRGLSLCRVDRPGPQRIVLLFGAFEGPEVTSLDASAKSRIVLVAEGHTPKPEEAEAARDAAGLLGLVDPRSWRKWMSGLCVAWGFYGRADIAAASELAPLGTQGLQPVGRRAELSDVLARFLVAAESLATSGTVP